MSTLQHISRGTTSIRFGRRAIAVALVTALAVAALAATLIASGGGASSSLGVEPGLRATSQTPPQAEAKYFATHPRPARTVPGYSPAIRADGNYFPTRPGY